LVDEEEGASIVVVEMVTAVLSNSESGERSSPEMRGLEASVMADESP
jgi:hypothetical protein